MALLTHVPVKHICVTVARPGVGSQDPAVFTAVLGNCLVAKQEGRKLVFNISIAKKERRLFRRIRSSVNLVNYSGRQSSNSGR